MKVVKVKKLAATVTSVVAIAVVAMLCAFTPSYASDTNVTKALPAATRTLYVPKTVTATIVVTETTTATPTIVDIIPVPATQQVVERSSVVLTKIEGSPYTMGFIIAGLALMFLGMLLFFSLGYREGDSNNKRFVVDAIKEIKERR